MVDELFEIQLDPGARREPATPLAVAAGSGEGASALTVELLLELGASPHGAGGVPPLPYACCGLGWNYPPGGDAARVAVLLAAGGRSEQRASQRSVRLGLRRGVRDPERVRLLLKAGANPTPHRTMDVGGMTVFMPFLDPLFMAAQSGSAACVRLLLDAEASVESYPENDDQPLAWAGSVEALETLLATGGTPG